MPLSLHFHCSADSTNENVGNTPEIGTYVPLDTIVYYTFYVGILLQVNLYS